MITARDVNFHTPEHVDHHWAETSYFSFYLPEHHLVCMIYLVARPGTGAMIGEVIVFNSLSMDRRNVIYFDSNHHMPLPEDFSNFTLPNGISLKSVNAPRDYRIDYIGVDDTEFHLDVIGLMEPYDIHDREMCPTAPTDRSEQITGSGFGAGYSRHFDMTVHVTGTFTLYGETFDVDCVDTMDHSWGPRPMRGMTTIGWQHAHFGSDYAVHTIWKFGPFAPTSEEFSVAHGYVLENGRVYGLTGGTLTMERIDTAPVSLRIDVTDRADRRHVITGRAVASDNWVCYTSLHINHVLFEYRTGDRTGHGIHQEAYPLDLMARRNAQAALARIKATRALAPVR